MKETDSLEIRKLAAQSILTMLSEEDQIAVVEFDATGRTLVDWTRGGDKTALFKAVNQVGKDGEYTDFRAGLSKALSMFADIRGDGRKIIFLLSDGRFEPNLKSEQYSPYSLEFQQEVFGKSATQKKSIKSKFQEKILPVARRMVESEIIPSCRQQQIEVFSVAFSSGGDKETLSSISEATNLNPPEIHYYFAENAVDLVRVFAELLSYWKNLLVIHQKEGGFYPGLEDRVFLDEFLDGAFLQFFTSQPAKIEIRNEKGNALENTPGTHPNLKVFSATKSELPSSWTSLFAEGKGDFREIVVGKSNLVLSVEGLKSKYLFGEQIEASISVRINTENAFPLLNPATRIKGLLSDETGHAEEIIIGPEEGQFRLRHRAAKAGKYRIRFTLFASTKGGLEIRPRPSRDYAFEIIPDYFIEPLILNYGNLKKGQGTTATILITSGFERRLEIKMAAQITQGSRGLGQVDKLPLIEEALISLEKPGSYTKDIELKIPPYGYWGDFEGEIRFVGNNGRVDLVRYRVHVPSWREWITLSGLVFAALLLAVLVYLAYIWGHLGTPRGVIRFVATPAGIVREDIVIGRLKRGILTKLLNWNRHVISIGGPGSDIKLEAVPPEFLIRLKFFRFGGNYIENKNSSRAADPVILVKDPVSDIEIERGPRQQYRLKSGTELVFKEYRIVFHDI